MRDPRQSRARGCTRPPHHRAGLRRHGGGGRPVRSRAAIRPRHRQLQGGEAPGGGLPLLCRASRWPRPMKNQVIPDDGGASASAARARCTVKIVRGLQGRPEIVAALGGAASADRTGYEVHRAAGIGSRGRVWRRAVAAKWQAALPGDDGDGLTLPRRARQLQLCPLRGRRRRAGARHTHPSAGAPGELLRGCRRRRGEPGDLRCQLRRLPDSIGRVSARATPYRRGLTSSRCLSRRCRPRRRPRSRSCPTGRAGRRRGEVPH